MPKTIHILTGPVKSGKTTRLIAWIRYHSNCAGILSPVINNKRHIYSIHNEQELLLETDKIGQSRSDELISIGHYSFLASAFQWAREELQTALEMNPRWMIIDEIGPLELAGHGLEPMVTNVLNQFERSKDHHLILVVRESLLDKVLLHYQIEGQYLVDQSFLEM
jgi:nucleoside-triphosphatase THEP1